MEQAAVTVLIYNPYGLHPWRKHSTKSNFDDLVNVQSSGAAIKNMILAAQDLGLGTLWICDIFYAYQELSKWIDEKSQFVAALSIGWPDEEPPARPRKPMGELVN